MRKVSIEEIIEHKILPFDIFSEFEEKIFSAGEALTPGKLLQLKEIGALYCEDINTAQDDKKKILKTLDTPLISKTEAKIEKQEAAKEPEKKQEQPKPQEKDKEVKAKQEQKVIEEKKEPVPEKPASPAKSEEAEEIKEKDNKNTKLTLNVETFDMAPSVIKRNKLSVDEIDISGYKGPINKAAKIDGETQLKIKAFYTMTINMTANNAPPSEILGLFGNIRDKIVQDIIFNIRGVQTSSQLKFLGEYNRCHAVNTAVLSGMVAKEMGLPENEIYDIVLGALLHDIGKTKFPEELQNKINLTASEQKEMQQHTRIGYRILRAEMELPENIALIALGHHEYVDGTGYPTGASGDELNTATKIVAVCNYFDNLTSNRTPHAVKNTKEALRILLESGTKKFAADALYKFIHMYSYNDTTNFEEMVL